MPLGRPRRRRRSGRPLLVFILTVVVLGGVVTGLWYAHLYLSRDLHTRIATLDGQVTTLRTALEDTEHTRDSLIVDLEDVKARLRFAETRYERDVPAGDARRLLGLVQDGLAQGANPDRLARLIQAGSRPMQCTPEADPRLLGVAHSGQRQAAGTLGFADDRVTVAVEGSTAVDERGRPEDWFDQNAAVRVRLTQEGGVPTTVEGILPLEHTIVVGDAEYRLSLTSARRGFVEVAVERCAFP